MNNNTLKSADGQFSVNKKAFEDTVYFSSLSDPEDSISIHSSRPLLYDYELHEIEDIIENPDILMRSVLQYRNRVFLYQTLQVIADNFLCYFDNDYGTILSGSDFIKKWNSNPDWSWVNDLDDD